MDQVDDIDQGLFRRLVYGVVENKIFIDHIIGKVSKPRLSKLDKNVLNILRIAIYEMVFLDTQVYASINEAVNSAKKFNFKSKGFVNGVLRNFDRNRDQVLKIDEHGDKYLAIKYSTNIEIIEYLKEHYKNYEEIVASFNDIPKLNLRVNDLKISRQELKEKLEELGYDIKLSEISEHGLIVDKATNITDLDLFKDGFFTIQDQSSIYVGQVVEPKSGDRVLDLCAAPGSKSTHLLQMMKDQGLVVANDIQANKLGKIQENFIRMNFTNYSLDNYDASKFIEDYKDSFDIVLVDAPCSGLGVIKRKPEIKNVRTMQDIIEISKIQKEILNQAYKYVKPRGNLIYSTCTLGPIENEDVIQDFLSKHDDMIRVNIDGDKSKTIDPSPERDGFFICKMTKKKVL